MRATFLIKLAAIIVGYQGEVKRTKQGYIQRVKHTETLSLLGVESTTSNRPSKSVQTSKRERPIIQARVFKSIEAR